jgi:ATP-binding cassette subfamily B protein
MRDLDMRTYRRRIAMVPQHTILFSGTIRENITYGLKNYTEDQVWAAIDAAFLREVIQKLPDGLDTRVGEQGFKLSGGQRQRLAIARALIRDPRVIILDEATSALDVISEKEVQNAIDNLVRGRTTFIVAHRLSTIRQANKVIVMKEGRAVEVGEPEELMRRNGEFARLKALQA